MRKFVTIAFAALLATSGQAAAQESTDVIVGVPRTFYDATAIDQIVTGLQAQIDALTSTNLQTQIDALDGRVSTVEGAVAANTLAIADKADQSTVDALDARVAANEAALPNKADVGHGHVVADVTDLQADLDGKVAISDDPENKVEEIWVGSLTDLDTIAASPAGLRPEVFYNAGCTPVTDENHELCQEAPE